MIDKIRLWWLRYNRMIYMFFAGVLVHSAEIRIREGNHLLAAFDFSVAVIYIVIAGMIPKLRT